MIKEYEVPRLLPSEVIAFSQHSFEQIPITDRRPNQLDARFRHRQFQAKVAHHGSDQGLLGKEAVSMKIQAQGRHHMVAIDYCSLFADKDGSIGITVQRDAKIRFVTTYRL